MTYLHSCTFVRICHFIDTPLSFVDHLLEPEIVATLEIRLLGGLHVRHDNADVTQFHSSKAAALLAYLAVSRRPHQRDALAGLLWGEMPDAAAANNLRQTLTNLRKLCGSHLLITRETVAFNLDEPHFVDVVTLMDGLDAESDQLSAPVLLRQTLALYQGDFLEGFFVRDAPDFEEWALTQRITLRELALHGWSSLTGLLMQSGEYVGAVDATSRLLALDPWREEAHCWRMLALARSGQPSAALAQYQTCRRILAQEFDAEPAAETTALYERIRAASRGPRHNLPAATTGFVGRQAEMVELRRLLSSPETRLLTILGPGGVGKTRLALETAAACVPAFLNGVWFVSLAEVGPEQSDALPLALVDALPMASAGAISPRQQVLDFLRQKEILLVLDNLEQMGEEPAWLGRLLAEAPEVKILVTSRQRLDLQAERIFPLDGLSLPQLSAPDIGSTSVELFLRRAQRLRPDFEPDLEDSSAVVRICRALQGLPLGIELAAAWVDQLTCQEIAGEIERSLDFLVTSRRDVSPRQRSLRAVFDWSWQRLSPNEQAFFQQLAVFRGPFRREAAVQVSGATPSVLAALIDKSLVSRRQASYTLHEVARHFASEKLRLAGADDDTLARHAHYYADLLAQNRTRLEGREQKVALEEIEEEIENVRTAWQWLVARRDVTGIDAAIDGLYPFIMIRSRFGEGLAVFRSARMGLEPFAAADRHTQLIYNRAKAREGRFLSSLSQYDQALTLLGEALAALRGLGAQDEVAFVLGHMGGIARTQGDLDVAEERLQECLALRRATHDAYGQAIAWLELAGIAFMRGDYATTRTRCQEGLSLAESAGDLQTTAHLLTGLSLSHRELGDVAQARSFGQRSLAIYEELGDQYGLMQAALTLGELNRQLGDHQAARQFCERAVVIAQEIGDRSGEADGHYRLGQIAAGLGQQEAALDQLHLALDLAVAANETPMILDALLEIALLVMKKDPARAGKILVCLLEQPQIAAPRLAQIHRTVAQLPRNVSTSGGSSVSLAEAMILASQPFTGKSAGNK